ncbi:dienelactone hydrolase family protein [Micromonospora sp. FIMYZ51]|uniref:dienelactone hydrolase family protein n=1 Tax=Micromonospora sp. FIMYZ51 TaxID=3051832 RepID=UPI00312024AD
MCFAVDACPPELPQERVRVVAGDAVRAQRLELISADGTPVSAAVAHAPQAGPGVVILPDVRGLYPFYERLAERFAQAGHDAIVVDYFARTAGLAPRGDDFDFQPHLSATTLEQVQADIAAAVAVLRRRIGVWPAVAVGFCFGGTHAFLAGANRGLDLDAVVGFYGKLSPGRLPRPAALASSIGVPLLGLFGGDDPSIPAGEIEEFDTALGRAGVRHQLITYPNAPHSFFDRSFEEYEEACSDAWAQVLDFLVHLPVSASGAPATRVPSPDHSW